MADGLTMDTREKLIELLQGARDKYINLLTFEKELIADHLIANGVTVQKWIPVTERLPENKKCVLMYSADGGVAEGVYEESRKRWIQWRWSVFDVPSVTHWMPLPEPPKGD